MTAVDSSVAIAAFGEWHEQNEAAIAVLDDGAALPAHALLETYSVLTGFPPPHRAAPEVVLEWMDDRFATVLPAPSPREHRHLLHRLASAGRIGGSVYDGLVALTAERAGAVLVTADVRAATIYELLETGFRLLDEASA